jgi:AcrR family transcriptional regulator
VGTKHDEQHLLDEAVAAALEHGLSELTFGRLAKRLGIADRTLVYYFTNKRGLFEAVLGQLAERLLDQLAAAFGAQRRSPDRLLAAAFPVLTTVESDRIFAVWFELAGLAAAGHEPHRELAVAMVDGWIDWLAERVDERSPARRRAGANALLATLDGALLLHHLDHRDEARAAIRIPRP